MYHYGPWNDSGWFIAFHIIGFLLFLIFVSIVFRLCFGGRFYRHYPDRPGSSAIDIAKQRYAKGEITKNEFDMLIKDLK